MKCEVQKANIIDHVRRAGFAGTPEGSARREFELLLLLGGSRKAAVQLWLRKQRIYANAQQAAGRLATEAKGSSPIKFNRKTVVYYAPQVVCYRLFPDHCNARTARNIKRAVFCLE